MSNLRLTGTASNFFISILLKKIDYGGYLIFYSDGELCLNFIRKTSELNGTYFCLLVYPRLAEMFFVFNIF
jgi:hypothetical protein